MEEAPPQKPAASKSKALAPQAPDSVVRCLARVSVEFGRPVDETEIRGLAPLTPSGMSVDQACRVAERMGYYTRREGKVDGEMLAEMPAPILLIGRRANAARLVLGHEEDGLLVYDGALDETVVLPAGALAAASLEAVMLKDKPPSHKEAPTWWKLAHKRVRSVIWEIILASSAINILALAMPFFAMTVFNKVVGQEAIDTLTVLVIGMIMIFAFEGVLRALRGYVSAHTGARMDALLGGEVMHHFLRIPYSEFEKQSAGTMVERVRQLDIIRAFFTGQMPIHIVDLAFVVLFMAVLFFIQPYMAYIVMVAAPLLIGVAAFMHKKQMELVSETFQAQAAKSSLLNETVNNSLTVKSLSLEAEIERRWEARVASAAWTSYRAGHLASLGQAAGHILQLLTTMTLLAVGALLVIDGQMSLGALIAGNMLASRVLMPLRQVASAWHQVTQVRDAFRRINEIMDEPGEPEPGANSLLPDLRGKIKVDNLTYYHDETRPPVLKNIDLEVAPGTMLAIIGPSGSGKSTLAKCIQGLYPPKSGRVVIDGTDVQHMSLAALRQQIGVVPQDSQLFAGTVRENISMGGFQRFPERVAAVAKFVGAHEFIQRLPKGYETVLSERGVGLSNGQRQLICIARALVRNPRILILDEATSDLDPVAEDFFLRNLRRAARGRTVIMVTHRLAPLSIVDQVALVIDGEIERIGEPKEVIGYAKTRMAEVARPS
ncbi:MAG: peptidase domain-containing ABC transporter [Pseudomonadota bacterium]